VYALVPSASRKLKFGPWSGPVNGGGLDKQYITFGKVTGGGDVSRSLPDLLMLRPLHLVTPRLLPLPIPGK